MDFTEHGKRVLRTKLQTPGTARVKSIRCIGRYLELVDRSADRCQRCFRIGLGVKDIDGV
jgi:hypothetical protein